MPRQKQSAEKSAEQSAKHEFEASLHQGVEALRQDNQEAYQLLAEYGQSYPFLSPHFLGALEQTGAVCPQTGWQPLHLVIRLKGAAQPSKPAAKAAKSATATKAARGGVIAVLPLYLKGHSYGEFVFDWIWADALERAGAPYYPKLLSAIPFVPASGPRLCIAKAWREDPVPIVAMVQQVIGSLLAERDWSSWHLLFPQAQEAQVWQQAKVPMRMGYQFQWFNFGYQHFEDITAGFASRKRKSILKERQTLADAGLHIEVRTGDEIDEQLWEGIYACYQHTYHLRGRPAYLSLQFFTQIGQTMGDQVRVAIAREPGNRQPLAAAIFFMGSDTLYGRHWGSMQPIKGLHFELCYYQGMEICLRESLERFDSGTQGEHKIARGFAPIRTWSAHILRHSGFEKAVVEHLRLESNQTREYMEICSQRLPYTAEARQKVLATAAQAGGISRNLTSMSKPYDQPSVQLLASLCPQMGQMLQAIGNRLEPRQLPSGYSGLVHCIIGQQLSIHAAKAIRDRLLAALDGKLEAAGVLGLTDDALRQLGISAAKIRTLRALSTLVEDGELNLLASLDEEGADARLTQQLLQIPGIGPWTVQNFMLASLQRPDVWPAGDLILQQASTRLAFWPEPVKGGSVREGRPRFTATEATEYAEKWRPVRSTAAIALWQWHGQRYPQLSSLRYRWLLSCRLPKPSSTSASARRILIYANTCWAPTCTGFACAFSRLPARLKKVTLHPFANGRLQWFRL